MTEEDLREHLIDTLLVRVEKKVRSNFDHYINDWCDYYDRHVGPDGNLSLVVDDIDRPTMIAAKAYQIAQTQGFDAALLWKLSQNSG